MLIASFCHHRRKRLHKLELNAGACLMVGVRSFFMEVVMTDEDNTPNKLEMAKIALNFAADGDERLELDTKAHLSGYMDEATYRDVVLDLLVQLVMDRCLDANCTWHVAVAREVINPLLRRFTHHKNEIRAVFDDVF